MAPKRSAERSASDSAPAKRRRTGDGYALDSRVPDKGMHVVDDYSVTLNQTNIGGNNNKYYIIQVLEGGGKFYAWNRWGRVGEDGAHKLSACASREKAIKEFESKFRSKSGNAWANRSSFVPKGGKYKIVETEIGGGGGGKGEKAPMGKLTEAQIAKGSKVLDKLKSALRKKPANKADVDQLSSEFYTLIPHDFGRHRPVAIATTDLLEAKAELLKFYLRMGFDTHEDKADISPISGVMTLPVPGSLPDACRGICNAGSVKESEESGKRLAAKQAGSPKGKMESHMYGALMLYTSNAIYTELNKVLRDKNRGGVKKYFKYLRLFFEATAKLPQKKRTLWRGLSVDLSKNPMYAVGKTVTWWGVSSCTADKKVADGFAGSCGGGCTVVTVEAKSACDISSISFYGNEKESILVPGTTFKVKSNTKKGNVTHILLQETGRAIE